MGIEESSDDFVFNMETIRERKLVRAVAREVPLASSLDPTTIPGSRYDACLFKMMYSINILYGVLIMYHNVYMYR